MSWGAAIGNLAGAIFGNAAGRQNAAEQHDWAVEDAKIAREWQERMSNTAHQREVADLRAAGLNPILSATGGAGAPVGGGAMANSNAAPVQDTSSLGSAAVEGALKASQRDLMKIQEQVQSTAADVNMSQKNLLDAQAEKTRKEAEILGPKSFIMDKVEDAIRTGSDAVKKTWRNFQDKDKGKSDSEVKREYQKIKMGGRP